MTNKQFIKKYADKDGNIDLSNKTIDSLPDVLDFEGNLSLRNSKIAKLPKKCSVIGNIDLRNARIETFSKDLWILGNLDLRGATIKNPAQQIQILGNLALSKNTKLTKLAENLEVHGECYVPLSLYALLATHLRVKNLDLSDDTTHNFPKSLCVDGNLIILPSHLKKLPNDLTVRGNFIVKNTVIPELPQNLVIGKDFRHDKNYAFDNKTKYFKEVYEYMLELGKIYQKNPVYYFDTEKYSKSSHQYKLPSVELLPATDSNNLLGQPSTKHEQSRIIIQIFAKHNIEAEVCRISPKAFLSTFELRIIGENSLTNTASLQEELIMMLDAERVKITKKRGWDNVFSIKVFHKHNKQIFLRELLEDELYLQAKSALSFPLGKDTNDSTYLVNLSTLPHLLVAGENPHEVDNFLNAMLLSLLYKSTPTDLNLLIIDTQNHSFEPYQNLPHLTHPIINDKDTIEYSLIWLLEELERRSKLFEEAETDNIVRYNAKNGNHAKAKLPYLVCIISELTDLVETYKLRFEILLYNLYEKAQEMGIHLILTSRKANNREMADIIDKYCHMKVVFQSKGSNFPYIDKAEELLGKNDMFAKARSSWLETFYSANISAEEVKKVVDFWTKQTK